MEFNQYTYDKDKIKQSLTIEDFWEIVNELGGEPRPIQNNMFVSKTISHDGGDSWKLYFYYNEGQGGIFKDYTGGQEAFDLFELVRIVKSRETGTQWELPHAVAWVASRQGILPDVDDSFSESDIKQDLIYLSNLDRINKIELKEQRVELKEYTAEWLKNLSQPLLLGWQSEGISKKTCDDFNIYYHAGRPSIIIPHYDIDNRLIGIRERELDEERILRFGKYHPTKMNNIIYSSPLGFNLYGLNKSKDNITLAKKAIIFESEKAVMQYYTWFPESCIAVAACGSSISAYQIKLLKNLGTEEIIVAFDKAGSQESTAKYVKKFYNFQKKYGNEVKLSFIYDKNNKYLDWKDSPTDKGLDNFIKLYRNRIYLY